jgi:HK97 family phage prohead protease
MKTKTEFRFLARSAPEVKGNTLYGYAAVFDSWTQIGDSQFGFQECIRKGCFRGATTPGADVRCLFNHDSNRILGRTLSGTLKLREDSTGLYFECTAPEDAPGARDVICAVARRDVSGCSFSFSDPVDRWDREGSHRELLAVNLLDVGPVTFPAYGSTNVSARAKQNHERTGTYTFTRSSESGIYISDELADERRRLQTRLLVAQIEGERR